MKGLSKEVKSAIIIGVVIVLLLVLGIIYGQKQKDNVAETSTVTTTVAVEEETTAAETTTAAAETTTVANTTSATVTIPASATVAKASDGRWALLNNGTVMEDITGIAKNDMGQWYIEKGYVNFNFTGKVVFNGVTYDIENGKVA